MDGYQVGPPGGERFGQPLYVPPQFGPGVEIVQWRPGTGAQAHILTEYQPGARVVMFENGMPPGSQQQFGPSDAEKAYAASLARQPGSPAVDMTHIHLLLLL